MSTDTLALPLELRFVDDGPGYLDGVVVPYNETTHLAAGAPHGERILPGAFASAVANPARVRLVDSHLDGTARRPYGVAVRFEDHPDGLYGTFRFNDTPAGREGREEARAATYGGLSIGFRVLAEQRGSDGVREVVTGELIHVALVDQPAYTGAKILAVRSAAPAADWAPTLYDAPDVEYRRTSSRGLTLIERPGRPINPHRHR